MARRTKRGRNEGGIDQRAPNIFRLRYRVDGRRYTKTFRGEYKDATKKLRGLLHSGDTGTHVEPSRLTVGEFVAKRVDQWEAAGDISARTAQRYRELVEGQIKPHLGDKRLQKLRPLDIEAWHAKLRTEGRANGEGGIAPRTIGHAHRVLSKALSDAARNDLVHRNVCKLESAPRVDD